ncbi:MAG: hypothetical protein KDA57_16995 [Planctomycetales bacterium]|nr:hypothetical protein [Planctomycetales bacterium]
MNESNPYDSPAISQACQGRGISRTLSFIWWLGLLSPFVLIVLDATGAIRDVRIVILIGIEPFVGANAFACGLSVMLTATTLGHDGVGRRILYGLASAAVMLAAIIAFFMLIVLLGDFSVPGE